jgi:hypothetical protein
MFLGISGDGTTALCYTLPRLYFSIYSVHSFSFVYLDAAGASLKDVVVEHNKNESLLPVYDPSSELIGITNCFFQRYPPKDEGNTLGKQ